MIGSFLMIFCILGIYLAEKQVQSQILAFDQITANLLDDDSSLLYCYRFDSKPEDQADFDAKHPCFPIRLDHQAPRLGRRPRALCVVARRTLETFPTHEGLRREVKRCPKE